MSDPASGPAFAALDGSHRSLPHNATRLADVAADAPIEVSVYLKRRPLPADVSSGDGRARMHAARSEAHRDDIERIRAFAGQHGLTVTSVEPARRLVKLSGPAGRLEAAFRTKLGEYHDGTCRFRACSGPLYVPQDLQGTIESILGLDTRPVARPRLVRPAPSATQAGHLPNEIGRLYGFPTGVTGAGQCIALIELGGGFLPADTTMAFHAMGLQPPKVVSVPVDGARNQPSPDSGADSEVALDIQIAGGVAPGAPSPSISRRTATRVSPMRSRRPRTMRRTSPA
jgi:kumamolisin